MTPFNAPDLRVSITSAARRSGLTQRAIRFYEDLGLVTAYRDRSGNRTFDRKGLGRLDYIAFARRAGLSLSQIDELLRTAQTEGVAAEGALLRELCEAKLANLDRLREEVQAVIASLPDRQGSDIAR